VITETGVSVFDSWSSSYWLVLVMKAGLVVVFHLAAFLDRQLHGAQGARAHARGTGPTKAGAFHGWAQIMPTR
jgi:hypothetical protein